MKMDRKAMGFSTEAEYTKSDVRSSDTITLTKEELKTFMDDVEQGIGSWSDTSYRICRFIGIDPTDGV